MIISFIIPVYNSENWIGRCLDSILTIDSNLVPYEVICINDGSSDQSLSILKSYSSRYTNVSVYSQGNKKQGAARNLGLNYSCGEFIWFIDSDDWIDSNFIPIIVDIIVKYKLDIVRIGSSDVKNNVIQPRSCSHLEDIIYEGRSTFFENKFSMCVPFYLIRRRFLLSNNLFFKEGIFYEDNEFVPRLIERCSRFLYLPYNIYYVFHREVSTTRNINFNNNIIYLFDVVKFQLEYIDSVTLSSIRKIYSKQIAKNSLSLLIGLLSDIELFSIYYKKMKNLNCWNIAILKSESFKHIFIFSLIRSPYILRIILKVYYSK